MAQLNGTDFIAKWATLFADNTTGDISAEDMRDFRQDIKDSFLNLLDSAYSVFTITASGTDTYTATLSPAITAYASTHVYAVKFTNANTGASTLNLNSLGAKSIVKNGGTALSAGDIAAGQIYLLAYDGTNLQIVGLGASGTILTGGTYTPSATIVSNLDSATPAQCQYIRVGSVVNVSGTIAIDPTTLDTLCAWRLSLPVASNLSIEANLAGAGHDFSTSSAGFSRGVAIAGDATNNDALFRHVAGATTARTITFTFTYFII